MSRVLVSLAFALFAATYVATALATHPANWVEALPSAKGSARDGSLSYPLRAKQVEGGIGRLVGAVRVAAGREATKLMQ
jgi:hypothetical protein